MALALTPEQATKVLEKDLENSIRKVGDGRGLTQSERARLLSIAYGNPSNTVAVPYARNMVELAEQLGITRRTLNNWQKQKDAPKPLSNGLHDVNAWREFAQAKGLKTGSETGTTNGSCGNSLETWKLRHAELDARKKEIELAILLRDYIPWEEVNHSIISGVSKAFSILRKRLLHENAPLYKTGDAVGNSELNETALDEAQQMAVEHFMSFLNERPEIPEVPPFSDDLELEDDETLFVGTSQQTEPA